MPIQIRVGTAMEIARTAADQVENVVKRANRRRVAVIGTATGATPEETYEELVRRVRAGQLSFAQTAMFGLDEYDGLAKEDPRSYHFFMKTKLWDPAGVPEQWRYLPNPQDPAAYDRTIQHSAGGGVDLWILGIGRTGHIAFNEPGEPGDEEYFKLRTRRVSLTETTRRDNAQYFDGTPESVPGQAITAGTATISDAAKIVLLAKGKAKAPALARAFEGPICPSCPASILQRHPDVLVLADADAVSELKNTPFFPIA